MVLQLSCRRCPFKTQIISNYVNHLEIHSLEKNFSFSCPVCAFKTSKKNCLRTHIYTHLKEVTARPQQELLPVTTWRCNVPGCNVSISTLKDLVAHFKEHFLKEEEIHCPLGSCATSEKPSKWVTCFTNHGSFKTHVSRYHKNATLPLLPPYVPHPSHEGLDQSDDVDDPSDDKTPGEAGDAGDNINSPPDEELFTVNQACVYIAQFYLKMEGDLNLPSTTVQTICENLANIVKFSQNIMKCTLMKELEKISVKDEVAEQISHVTLCSDPLFRVHNTFFGSVCLLTEHRRYKFFKEHFDFVEPVKTTVLVSNPAVPPGAPPPLAPGAAPPDGVPPGASLPLAAAPVATPQAPAQKKKTIQVVDFEVTLKSLLKDPDVQKEVDIFLEKQASGFFRSDENKTNRVYRDFTDGEIFRKHPASNTPSIFLLLSCDAFGVSNPLGAAKNKHKTNGLYYVLGNLPPEKRSKVDVLQLSALFLEEHLKVLGTKNRSEQKKVRWDECLKPVIDQLNDMFRAGIEYKGNKLPVYVLFMLGDNLGQHQIGGFTENFSDDFWCRLCEIQSAEFQQDPTLVKPLRTPEDYEGCSYVASTHPQLTHFKGVKFNSSLNRLPEFHVCLPALPPCIAHDLFEGVVAYDMMLIIKHFIKLKWFTREELNARIKSFPFFGKDASQRPCTIDLNHKKQMKIKLSGSAVQNWNLLRFFPLILGDLVKDVENRVWKLYLKLKRTCEYVCAPAITEEEIKKLIQLTEKYLAERKVLFKSPLKAKHHFLSHFGFLIRLFGPLIRLWTLRMESFHRLMKEAASACHNFIDVPFTMAHKCQLRKAYVGLGRLFSDSFTFSTPRNFEPFWGGDVKDYIKGLNIPHSAVCVNSVEVHGTEFKRGMWLLLEQQKEKLMVGQIVALFCSEEIVFILKKHVTLADPDGMGLHEINTQETAGVCHMSSVRVLASYYPLQAYPMSGKMYLTFKHKPLNASNG